MFSRKKNLPENLRRRFQHALLSKRKDALPSATVKTRHARRFFRANTSPAVAWLRRTFLWIALTGAFLGGIYLIFFSSFFEITKITTEKSGNAVSGSALSPFLDKLRGKNLLFVSTDELTTELEQTFKNEILLVTMKKSYPNRIIVKVDEYPAVANFRVITPENTQKFVLNQIGYSILQNYEQKDLPVLVLKAPKLFPLQKSILIPEEKFKPIVLALQKFPSMFGLKIVRADWKKTERELHLQTERNFAVWLDLTADIEKQLLKLKQALPKLDIQKESLEYIDLRIAGGENEKVILKRGRARVRLLQ